MGTSVGSEGVGAARLVGGGRGPQAEVHTGEGVGGHGASAAGLPDGLRVGVGGLPAGLRVGRGFGGKAAPARGLVREGGARELGGQGAGNWQDGAAGLPVMVLPVTVLQGCCCACVGAARDCVASDGAAGLMLLRLCHGLPRLPSACGGPVGCREGRSGQEAAGRRWGRRQDTAGRHWARRWDEAGRGWRAQGRGGVPWIGRQLQHPRLSLRRGECKPHRSHAAICC
eukprot:1143499-Pelagomonas_calceolata.AAC.10